MFVRKPSAAAVTMEFLRAVLRSSLIFLGLPPAIPLRDGTVLTKVKLWNVVVFHDYWDRNLPLQDLVDTWDQACSILNDSIPVRLVGAGGNMNPDFPLRYFTRSNPEGITVSTISFVVGMRGGGPSDSSSSSEQKEIVKQRNNLATFLLSEGADLKECTRFVDSIFKAAGHTAVGMILAQKNTNMKWEGIVQLANTMHVKPPDRTSRLLKTNKKIHARFAGQNRLITDDIQVDTLILQKGFVRNSDDSDCPQTQKVVPNSSGVVLMKYGDAKPWIDAQETISQDELAIAVVGHCGDDSGSCQKCQIPVTYHGSPLILQACLHNLGAKHVSLQCDDHDEIPCHETHVIGFTAFKEEISPEDWQRLIKSPVKNILQRLFGENAEIGFSTPPWGRSFFDNGKRSDPEHATTVQFHGRISKTDLKATLKASGTSGIYTVPKSEDRKISSGYRIVWLQQSPVDLTISLSKCSNHLGLVRSARGSLHNRGIRFEKDDFPGAFSLLRPSDPLPNLVSSNFYFKVQPVPVGSTAEQVQQWIDAHSWSAKPVKALTGNAWLCASEKRFTDTFAHWNKTPVLIKWIESKENRTPIILAGQMTKNVPLTVTPSSNVETMPNGEDPWKQWIANHNGTGLQPLQPLKFVPQGSQGPSQARKIEAPIEDRFSKHAADIQEMKDKTEKELTSMKECMLRLEKTVQDQGSQIQSSNDQCQNEFAAIRTETQTQFGHMANMFQDSLQKALVGRDQEMNQQFAEIKAMLASKTSASPQTKRAKGNNRDQDDPAL